MATGILLFLLWDVLERRRSSRSRRRSNASTTGARFSWLVALLASAASRRADEPRLLRRVDEGAPRARAARPGRGVGRRVRARALRRALARALARALDRDRDRAAQLLRGPRDRPVGRARTRSASRSCSSSASACTTRPRASASSRRSRATRERPSWRFLLLLGLIGGGPTFVGTLVGQAWRRRAVSVALPRARRRLDPLRRHRAAERLPAVRLTRRSTAWGILLGLVLGFATDFILVAAGV